MHQRQYERKQREALKSSHGPTAETHDQVNNSKHFLEGKNTKFHFFAVLS